MSIKVFISDYTFRTEAQQGAVLSKAPHLIGVPVYSPKDFSVMFRKTSRVERDTYYAASVACFAPDEAAFKKLLSECRKVKACLASIEEGFSWTPQQSTGAAIKAWRDARVKGAARVGAEISAKNRRAKSKAAVDTIEHLWCLPSKGNSIKKLEKLSGVARGTIVSFLGNRTVAQINYQAAQKRKERRNAKAN